MTATQHGPMLTGQGKSQRAYAWIKERIAEQAFSPGYRLVLGAIAAELDMSSVPVREAIRRLEAEGLVTFTRNVGAQVAMVDESQYRNAMHTLGILEGAATALAVADMSVTDIAGARSMNNEMREHLHAFDPRGFTKLNHQFHEQLFQHCPNPRLLELVNAEWTRLAHLRMSTFSFIPGRAQTSVNEHDHILDLIEKSAPVDEIELAVRRHRWATLAAYLAHERPRETAISAVR